ncbi:spermatogenesis-associated protein 6 isoform X2 [Xenopus laevis]|nr:spermatogenesis-associated protein 6 isoform X2 [Xenopus laevis]
MCELSQDAKQRLAHLNLGPYEFKKETNTKPPFVVKHVDPGSPCLNTTPTSCILKGSINVEEWSRVCTGNSLLGSYKPKDSKFTKHQYRDDLEGSLDSLEDHLFSEPAGRMFHSTRLSQSASSVQKHPPSPILKRSSLRERFQSDQRASANWEEIHTRVKNMLRTHSGRQRLHSEKTVSWQDESHKCNTEHDDTLGISDLKDRPSFYPENSVHLHNGEFWSNKAALYRGKSHRSVFEESLDKIYKNMYRKASEGNIYRKSYSS